jgi:hypothetical protein
MKHIQTLYCTTHDFNNGNISKAVRRLDKGLTIDETHEQITLIIKGQLKYVGDPHGYCNAYVDDEKGIVIHDERFVEYTSWVLIEAIKKVFGDKKPS